MKCQNTTCEKKAAPCCDYCLSHQSELDDAQYEHEFAQRAESDARQIEAYHSFVGPYPRSC